MPDLKPLLLHLQTVNFLQTCKYNQNAVANQSKLTNLLQFTCRETIYPVDRIAVA